ncbi:MAG: hypothetical protein KC549_02950 [Myxococcales bacterium]|nr:hypothetical protein [Myxococcales bacterium]MCB9548770.1 hypothetical protein [Myxococcales bacterium]
MLRAPLILVALLLSLGGCVVKDELEDGIREVLPTLRSTTYLRNADGSGQVDFTFNYLLGIVDDAGIDEVRWEYAVITPAREIIGAEEQEMRKAQPEKTQILVQGDRSRSLVLPPGALRANGTYVLSVALFYRGELFGEKFKKLVEGETLTEEVELDDLPRFNPR